MNSAPVILYAAAVPTEFRGTTEIRVTLTRAEANELRDQKCKYLTLLISGILAAKLDATGVRVSVDETPVGSFSFYGFESGKPRALSFSIPPAAVKFNPLPAAIGLKVQLLDYQSGSLTVDSFRIVCSNANG